MKSLIVALTAISQRSQALDCSNGVTFTHYWQPGCQGTPTQVEYYSPEDVKNDFNYCVFVPTYNMSVMEICDQTGHRNVVYNSKDC